MQPSTLYGLVLAGGKSARMGSDKSLIVYHNKPQREYVFELLSTCCEKVFTSCKSSENIPAHLNPLPDAFNIETPLNGILSAFQKNSGIAWLTLPIDMPFIDKKSVEFLLRHRDQEKVATCFYDSEGKFPEPLFTLWEAKAYPLLQAFHDKGKFSPRDFLTTHAVNILKAPDPDIHVNINSPEDLEAYRKSKRI